MVRSDVSHTIRTSSATPRTHLPVPFMAQAPEGNWVEPWYNACEETSLAMVELYYRTHSSTTPSIAEAKKSIMLVMEYKNKEFGSSLDESPERVAEIANTLFGWHASVKTNSTLEDIKKQINKGHPVLVPFDTRKVVNSNFINPKPDYHMAVIIGYDDERQQFIVHDPGTSDGEEFRYSYTELMEANNNYTIGDTNTKSGNQMIFTRSW